MVFSILDVILPVAYFVCVALATIPVIKFISTRKSEQLQTTLKLIWFFLIYTFAVIIVIFIATLYYSTAASTPYINITITSSSDALYSSSFLVDAISIFMAILFVGVSAFVFLYALFAVDFSKRPVERYFSVMLLVTGTLIGAIFSGDFLTLFIFWEASAGSVIFLVLYERNADSIRAALKYLIMIIIASCFIVYGLSIIYGICGTLNYWGVKAAVINLPHKALFTFAFLFIVVGYGTEAAVVPFHMWLPDAYTSAPASSSSFIASLVDQGSYYILVRLFVYILTPPAVIDWRNLVGALSVLTIFIANIQALIERDVKRLFAMLCIADVGYNLMAITSVTPIGTQANLYFFLTGGITMALAFMCVGIFDAAGIKTINDFRGVARRYPLTSFALIVAMLSFAGFPPMAGFFGKYLVFTAAIESDMVWVAVLGALTTVLQSVFLIILFTQMFAKTPTSPRAKEPIKLLIPIFILVVLNLTFGMFPQLILNLINPVVTQFYQMPVYAPPSP